MPDGHTGDEDPVIVRAPRGLRALAKAMLDANGWDLRTYVVACLRALVADPAGALRSAAEHRPPAKRRGRPPAGEEPMEITDAPDPTLATMTMTEVVADLGLGVADMTDEPRSPLRDLTPMANLWRNGERVYARSDVEYFRARRKNGMQEGRRERSDGD